MFHGKYDGTADSKIQVGYSNFTKLSIPNFYFFQIRQLLEPQNTPFCNRKGASAAKRLWNNLVHQESVQDIFIRAVFGKRRSMSALNEEIPHPEPTSEPVKIIHKDQDSIAAFTLNQVRIMLNEEKLNNIFNFR